MYVSSGVQMNEPSALARAVSQRFKTRQPSAFPTRDINGLIPDDEDARDLFHFQILMFLSGIAGYASGGWRIHRKPIEALKDARRFLSHSFFEKHPEYERYRFKIQAHTTPNLFRSMEEAEQNRADLLKVVADLLSQGDPTLIV